MKGIAVSKGVSVAKVFKLEYPDLSVSESQIENIDQEIEVLKAAGLKTKSDLEKIYEVTLNKLGAEKAAVFQAHLLMLQDPELLNNATSKIKNNKCNAAFALKTTADEVVSIFEAIDDAYMRERAADVRDVTTRLLANILNKSLPDLTLIDDEVIIIADDLTPSETALLDAKYTKGFVTNKGGYTSHTSIIARTLQIPAVVGLDGITSMVKDGDVVGVNGSTGDIIINPSASEIEEYNQLAIAFAKEQEMLLKYRDLPSVTKDGSHVELACNIAAPSDLDLVLANNADGIGLFRSEFLFMDNETTPSEDAQCAVYKEVLERMNNKPVVIRTIDIGGDKELPYLKLDKEDNPFLGYRALRFCIASERELFKTQLRALVKASSFGNLKIMFPMVSTLEEFREAKAIYNEAYAEIKAENIAVSDSIEVGIMIEVPAAALNAYALAKEVDFFSVGTNDLVGYTFAADRMNEKVSYLYQPYHPSILRLLKMVIDASHKEGKWTGMCGEMAGDLKAIPLLVGLGLDEFSMSASSILPAKRLIASLDKVEMQKLVEQALELGTNDEVIALVSKLKN